MRTVIVDDESQIREGIRILLSRDPSIEVVGEADSAPQAIELINELKPDLVFLDIQLKNQTGFSVLDQLDYLDFHLVFVTAFNQYAIQAFKYNAFDYILKPIDPVELDETIIRLENQRSRVQAQLNILKENSDLEKLVIKTTEEIYVLPVEDIVRCEADKGYTFFFMKDNKRVLSSKTLKEYEKILPEQTFARVHQSHLVNINFISGYDKSGFLILKNGDEVPVSVRKRHLVKQILEG